MNNRKPEIFRNPNKQIKIKTENKQKLKNKTTNVWISKETVNEPNKIKGPKVAWVPKITA